MTFKINPICPIQGCQGWCEVVYIKGHEHLKCKICGFTRKVTKKSITPVGKNESKEEVK